MKKLIIILLNLFLFCVFPTIHAAETADPIPKKWTFLIFLNAKNNLDRFGYENLKAMEKIGSNAQVNIVVEWGTFQTGKTVRLLVQKSTDPGRVTSPILQDLGSVDMGDYKTLEDFIAWGVKNFPAQHYFINVWNHGSGWHDLKPQDISWDYLTGNSIKTEELGQVMAFAAHTMGHRVDIYGSDACLMGMAEVADEMGDSVDYFVGSQELEPGPGWPYADFLFRWISTRDSKPSTIAKTLVDAYVKSYENGSNGKAEVTFSAYDVQKLPQLNKTLAVLSQQIQQLNASNKMKVFDAIKASQTFDYRDYVDLLDFIKQLRSKNIIDPQTLTNIETAAKTVIIANDVTPLYQNATGMSVWLPTYDYTYYRRADRYQGLKFNQHTKWNDMLAFLL